MFTLKTAQISLLGLLLGVSSLTPFTGAIAQPYPIYGDTTNDYDYRADVVNAGTRIPTTYEKDTLTLEPGTIVPLTLKVASPIRGRNGMILIPTGSEIEGQLEPAGQGVRYVAKGLKIDNNTFLTLNAASGVVGQTETVRIGASTGDIIKGTLAGAGAATIIAGTTGDRKIKPLEVLGGAAFGTLAGWALPTAGVIGGGTKEVVTVNPNRDLTLVLQSSLAFGDNSNSSYDSYPNRYPSTRPTTPNSPSNNGRFW
jgi:hypothetical protein